MYEVRQKNLPSRNLLSVLANKTAQDKFWGAWKFQNF